MKLSELQAIGDEIRRRVSEQHRELKELTQFYLESFAKWEKHASVEMEEEKLAVKQRLANVEESMTKGVT